MSVLLFQVSTRSSSLFPGFLSESLSSVKYLWICFSYLLHKKERIVLIGEGLLRVFDSKPWNGRW